MFLLFDFGYDYIIHFLRFLSTLFAIFFNFSIVIYVPPWLQPSEKKKTSFLAL